MDTVPAKKIITPAKGGAWFGIDYNMNLYRGCCHSCIYCDSRSNCYGIEDFDKVRMKENAIAIVRRELSHKVKKGVVATGAMSDPYNPFENELKLTRRALELLDEYEYGAAIATKSDLILRDKDILGFISEHSPVICKITVTTVDDSLSKKLEPGAPPSSRRLEAVAQLSNAGIFTGILMMPVLPFLEDTPENIVGIVRAAKESGARFIYPALGVTLRQNQREWYFNRLEELFPSQRLRERYQHQYGNRYQCAVPGAKQLWSLFCQECDRAGILYKMQDIIAASRMGYENPQLSLF